MESNIVKMELTVNTEKKTIRVKLLEKVSLKKLLGSIEELVGKDTSDEYTIQHVSENFEK